MAAASSRGPYFLPHPPHAEDQPHATLILTTHVAYRFAQAGALVGAAAGGARRVFGQGTGAGILRASGRGALVGTVLSGVATFGRMRGREPIEWQDRAWRLLENRGQVSTDRWSGAGAAAAAVVAAARAQRGWVALGTVGLGSLLGCAGSVGFRVATGEFQ